MSGRVVHCKREAFDVYVGRGRGSVWGNPFVVMAECDRMRVIADFAEYLDRTPDLLRRLPELAGKVLGCWCAPKACHGDVLVRRSRPYLAGCPACAQQPGELCRRVDSPKDLASVILLDQPHAERILAGADHVAAELGRGADTHDASAELIGDVAARRLF